MKLFSENSDLDQCSNSLECRLWTKIRPPGTLRWRCVCGCSEAPGTYNMYLGRDLSLWRVSFDSFENGEFFWRRWLRGQALKHPLCGIRQWGLEFTKHGLERWPVSVGWKKKLLEIWVSGVCHVFFLRTYEVAQNQWTFSSWSSLKKQPVMNFVGLFFSRWIRIPDYDMNPLVAR